MKKIMFFLVFSGLTTIISAQKYADVGIIGGTTYYLGDMNFSKHFHQPSFAIGGIYRYSLNYIHAFRLNGIYANLKANSDLVKSRSNFFNTSNPTAFKSSLMDIALLYEFNFLKYRTTDSRYLYSPYITFGLGYSLYLSSNVNTKNHFNIPFGLGIKLNVDRRISVGAAYTFRKSFSDNIDGISNQINDDNNFSSSLSNKDWYTFVGIFITYKFFKFAEICPAYLDE